MAVMRRPKKLIVCCDGTWNRPEPTGRDRKFKVTNVLKLMRAIRTSDDEGRHQVTYYDTGVGTDRGIYDKYIGGMMGLGLSAHVKKAYRFLANNFEEGDELYMFGFSRGAYTVRVLSGMIGAVGLLRPKDLANLPEVFSYFRTPPHRRKRSTYHDLVMNRLDTRYAPIKFLGVWDTVGALGVPIPLLKWATMWRVGFFNAELGGHIEYAYHALAIDEKRRPFAPNLWTHVDRREDRPQMTKDVCQAWFPGVHADIGGGQRDVRLSDEALIWMANRATDCGLAFDSQTLPGERSQPRYMGKMENSFTFIYKPLCLLGIPPYRRPIGPVKRRNLIQRIPAHSWAWKPLNWIGVSRYQSGLNEMIHESARQRLMADPTSYSPHYYQPSNLRQAIEHVPVFSEQEYTKRQHWRSKAHGLARISDGEKTGMCAVVDYSPNGGVCLHDHEQIVGDHSNKPWSVKLPDDLGGHRRVRIAWKHGQKIGLEFIQTARQHSSGYPRVA